MARARQIVFRIFYSTSFTVVFLIQICFICVTPADAIYESYKRRRTLDIFLIAGAYVVTALIAALIYASRLYTNRSVLKDIPKTFMPIEKEELPGRRVHKLIEEHLEKSAVIAYQARPRSRRVEHDTQIASARVLALCKSRENTDPNVEPRWGKIDHPGWSSPASKELPNLEYATVIDELTDLIEAKAVSLAPVDPLTEPGPDGLPLPDPRVIDELTRPETMCMRPYLRYLIEIGVVPDNSLTVAFLSAYERARFSSEPLSEQEFQALMRMFAELLRNMTPVDLELLDLDASSYHYESEPSTPDDQHQHHDHHRPQGDRASITSTLSDSGSVRHNKLPPRRVSEDSVPSIFSVERDHDTAANENDQDHSPSHTDGSDSDDEGDGDGDRLSLRTAPSNSAHRSLSRPALHGRGSSSRFFSATSRHGLGLQPTQSQGSMLSRSRSSTSRRSGRSNGGGSVIRLARPDDGHGLPFTIQVPSVEHDELGQG